MYDLTRWVCENHPDREWSPVTDCPVPGCGGAGMPVPVEKFRYEPNGRDDYLVILVENDQMVGAIHRVYRAIPEPWRWRVDSRYAKDLAGWAADLPEAMAAFRKAWDSR